MNEFTNFTEKDYQSYINLLRLAFDAVLNAETLDDAKEKASRAAVGQIHSGYGEFEIAQANQRIAELERHNKLLRAVGMASENYWIAIEGAASPKIIEQFCVNLYDATQAAVDGGALEGGE